VHAKCISFVKGAGAADLAALDFTLPEILRGKDAIIVQPVVIDPLPVELVLVHAQRALLEDTLELDLAHVPSVLWVDTPALELEDAPVALLEDIATRMVVEVVRFALAVSTNLVVDKQPVLIVLLVDTSPILVMALVFRVPVANTLMLDLAIVMVALSVRFKRALEPGLVLHALPDDTLRDLIE